MVDIVEKENVYTRSLTLIIIKNKATGSVYFDFAEFSFDDAGDLFRLTIVCVYLITPQEVFLNFCPRANCVMR